MSKLRVESFTISLDGFGAGPDQDINNPLGVGGTSLHGWLVPTRTLQQRLFGNDGGETGVDDEFAARGFQNIGAWILGRNMFGPVRGPWPDESWRGWWGENPVYHVLVFVLTNHARPPLVMEGGTTFHFVTEGPAVALGRARAAAGGKDVRVGDVVEYAYSVQGHNPVFGGHHFGSFDLDWDVPVAHRHARLLWPRERPLHWKLHNQAPAARVTDTNPEAMTEALDTTPLLQLARQRSCIIALPRIVAKRQCRMRFLDLDGPIRRGQPSGIIGVQLTGAVDTAAALPFDRS